MSSAAREQQRLTTQQAPTSVSAARVCDSRGHQSLPAAAIGIFDDGDQACADTAYCASCTLALTGSGEFTITEVLDALSLGATACPTCRGTGRLNRDTGDPVGPHAATSPQVAAVLQALQEDDDQAPNDLTGLFYATAYWHLRGAVEDLLQGLGPAASPVEATALPRR